MTLLAMLIAPRTRTPGIDCARDPVTWIGGDLSLEKLPQERALARVLRIVTTRFTRSNDARWRRRLAHEFGEGWRSDHARRRGGRARFSTLFVCVHAPRSMIPDYRSACRSRFRQPGVSAGSTGNGYVSPPSRRGTLLPAVRMDELLYRSAGVGQRVLSA